jgi:hypothetical protein
MYNISLTNFMGKSPVEKALVVAQLVKSFITVYGTQRFVTAFAKARVNKRYNTKRNEYKI